MPRPVDPVEVDEGQPALPDDLAVVALDRLAPPRFGDPPGVADLDRLGWQLARLALTFGEDRVRKAVITDPDAPLPEQRWSWRG